MTVKKPTPTGISAATTEPKTKSKIISESGPETASADQIILYSIIKCSINCNPSGGVIFVSIRKSTFLLKSPRKFSSLQSFQHRIQLCFLPNMYHQISSKIINFSGLRSQNMLLFVTRKGSSARMVSFCHCESV